MRMVKCVALFSASNCTPELEPREIFFSLIRCEPELAMALFFAPSRIWSGLLFAAAVP